MNATASCEFVSTGNLSLDLGTFYGCINDFLIDNCRHFFQNWGCDVAETHLIKCGKIPVNCSEWPVSYHEKVCCKAPEIFSDSLHATCNQECSEKEYFEKLVKKCLVDCLVRETKVLNDDKIDLEAAKKVLSDNANNTEDWKNPINDAVEICDSTLKSLWKLFFWACQLTKRLF